MQKTLRAETIALVKATVPALVAHGPAITSNMYDRLLQDPHIRALFNQANQKSGSQVQALAGAILGYAQNIDNLEALVPVVERIAQKHIGYNILSEHYPYVASALIGAIKEVLGASATEEILTAWGEAYWFLADILKGREQVIREEIAQADGGWSGWRQFVVSERIRESEIITSLVLRPVDGKTVLRHRPGQYLTFRFNAPDQSGLKRNYSISCAPNGEYYRISVKREPNGQGGSRFLHDHAPVGTILEITPPSGDFFLSNAPNRPIILLSGGVGLTPMVSMVETIAIRHPGLETHYVHGTMNSATHAMNDHIHALAQQHGRISVTTFYSDPREGDVLGENHDFSGFVTTQWLEENTPFHQADFYLCGPKPFLSAFVGGLSRAGVASDRIHYEFFGPAEPLAA